MLLTTYGEKPAFIKQKLPTEIIGIICGFSDFETHTAIRTTCSSVRLYVPQRKVVGFKEYKELIILYKLKSWCSSEKTERRRVFQERFHLDLRHDALKQDQVECLQEYEMDFELCRISRKVLGNPEAYKGIDLRCRDCYFLVAAIRVDDIDLLVRLLQVPFMDPAAWYNRAIIFAALFGRREIVQFLLQDPRVDPSSSNNTAIRLASQNGHHAVVQALLQDPRVRLR